MVGGTHLGGVEGPRMTVFAILAAAATRQLRAIVSDGTAARSIGARLLPLRSGPVNLRFAVIALPGTHCVERLTTRNSVGEALWQGALEEHSCGNLSAR